jgi:putative ABC transport system substrate-binding protein
MNIRVLLGLAGSIGVMVALLVSAAPAPNKVYRVGVLTTGSDPVTLSKALRDFGYIEGQNLVLEVRAAAARLDRLPALASELVEARVDVIAAMSPPAIQAAKTATSTIPIVMAFTSIDPVRSGFVTSLARPGGNITGVAMIADEIAGKRLSMLKQMLPQAKRIAILAQVNHSASTGQVDAARQAAKALAIEIEVFEVRDSTDYESALAGATKRTDGLFIAANPTFAGDAALLAALARKHRLPTLCEWREMAVAGCLMAYGPNGPDLARRVATYLDRILQGAQPAILPVEQPTKFDLTINLDTAKTLGVTVPRSLLLQADVTP